MSQTYRTTYVHYVEDQDSIWEANYVIEGQTTPDITETIAREIVQERLTLQGDKLIRLLLHVDGKLPLAREAKVYLSGLEGMQGVAAAAIVYDKTKWEVMANFMPWVRRFPIKPGIFIDSNKARDWLTGKPLTAPDLSTYPAMQDWPEDTHPLSQAELEILSDLDEGLSTKEIALNRNTEDRTVEAQQRNIYIKLNARGARKAVAKARRLGLLPLLLQHRV